MREHALPTDNRTAPDKVRHSKEDALSEREFQLLLEGCGELDEYYGFQARFVILCAGRLGLRAGEIAHMTEEWVDWRRNMIVIPRFDPCDKGKDGGPCGQCRQNAKQRVRHNDGMDMEEALRYAWSAKAAEAAPELNKTNIYPHALRATAASYHAARGLDVLPLQSLMGWVDLSTAQNYIQKSGENTARALHMTHSR